MEQVLEKIQKNYNHIVKIKMFNDRPKLQYLTWRISGMSLYMYDCGENYATVYNLETQKELFDKIQHSFNNHTKEIKIKYKDGTKEIIHF